MRWLAEALCREKDAAFGPEPGEEVPCGGCMADAYRIARALLESDWLAEVKATAWDEGQRAGADLGVTIGERVLGAPGEWPESPVNPYRATPGVPS